MENLNKETPFFFPGTHIGLVLFSTNATTMIRFDGKGQHSEEIKTQIANMRYPGGSTRLSLALSTARQQLFSVQGGTRIDVTRVVLAVTDGASNEGELSSQAFT